MTKVVFCHIPKTAGTSISGTLRRIAGVSFGGTHETARLRLERFGNKAWNNHFKFTIIRNPWGRLVSLYYDNAFLNALGRHAGAFDTWIHDGMPFDHAEFKSLFSSRDARNYLDQDAFFCDLDGSSLVDFVGRFERLEQEWNYICERLNLPATPLPHFNRGEHKPYWEYYTLETKKLVADRFGEFIERFKYIF